jgi:HK97 family phage major capsid protein
VKTALRSPDSAWLMRRLTVAAVRKLKDGQGNYLWQPDFTKYAGGSLLGYAVMEGEDMPAIGANSLSIAFGNWTEGYLVYDHTVGIRVLRDPYTTKGQVFFYTTKRTGGNVKNFDAIKVVRFGT